jgi:hypothetical protein
MMAINSYMNPFKAALSRFTIQLGISPDEVVFPDSEAISKMAFDEDTKELYVTYVGGGNYTYYNVSYSRWKLFEAAMSKGQYINERIKPNYVYSRGFI